MTESPFARPSDLPSGGGTFPTLEQLAGRLLVIRPRNITLQPNFDRSGTSERLEADVTFLDGATLTQQVNRKGQTKPLDAPINPGDTMTGMYITATVLVRKAQALLAAGGGQMMLGRLIKLPAKDATKNDAWGLDDPTAADVDAAVKWKAFVDSKSFTPAAPPAPAPAPESAPASPWSAPAAAVPTVGPWGA